MATHKTSRKERREAIRLFGKPSDPYSRHAAGVLHHATSGHRAIRVHTKTYKNSAHFEWLLYSLSHLDRVNVFAHDAETLMITGYYPAVAVPKYAEVLTNIDAAVTVIEQSCALMFPEVMGHPENQAYSRSLQAVIEAHKMLLRELNRIGGRLYRASQLDYRITASDIDSSFDRGEDLLAPIATLRHALLNRFSETVHADDVRAFLVEGAPLPKIALAYI